MSVASEEEICGEFQTLGVVIRNPDIIDKMREISIVHKVPPCDLAEHWFAFCTSNGLDSQPTVELLARLENEEFNSKKRRPKSSINKTTTTQKSYLNVTSDDHLIDDSDCLLEAYGTPDICAAKKRQRTPESATSKRLVSSDGFRHLTGPTTSPLFVGSQSPSSAVSSTPSTKYVNRTNAGSVQFSFGDCDWKLCSKSTSPITIKPYGDETSILFERYKYMLARFKLMSTVLDGRINEMSSLLKATHNINDFFNLGQPTSDQVTVVGMVACDGNGRINQNSIVLTGSSVTSDGCNVKLDVSQLAAYSLFPGQIVALDGVNDTGLKFVAHKLYPNIAQSLPINTLSLSQDLSVIVAAGPYMTSDSISYDPMCDILNVVVEQKPHVCILIGPFVDAKQKHIKEGNFPDTYIDIFNRCMELIFSCSRGSSTQFIIVPSSRDIHHDPVYPTPSFSCSKAYSNEKVKNVRFVSDPCLLDIGGLVVGITSADVLMHLGREEISFPSIPDRLGRLASHLLLQHSFYPIYPPSKEMNIDYERLEKVGRLPVTPHILILPSDLNCFVKEVHGCCCINPQRLVRGTSGGTYTRLLVKSNPSSESVSSRIGCQISRI